MYKPQDYVQLGKQVNLASGEAKKEGNPAQNNPAQDKPAQGDTKKGKGGKKKPKTGGYLPSRVE